MYLDPGFGSMVIQALVGVIAVAGSSLFLFRRKVSAFFARVFGTRGRRQKDGAGVRDGAAERADESA